MAVAKPQSNKLNVRIGENKKLQETTSEKFANAGRGIFGISGAVENFAEAQRIQEEIQSLEPAALAISEEYGLPFEGVKNLLLTRKITPQGLAQFLKTNKDIAGQQARGGFAFDQFQKLNQQAGDFKQFSSPQNIFGVLNKNTSQEQVVDSSFGAAPTTAGGAPVPTGEIPTQDLFAGPLDPSRVIPSSGQEVPLQGGTSVEEPSADLLFGFGDPAFVNSLSSLTNAGTGISEKTGDLAVDLFKTPSTIRKDDAAANASKASARASAASASLNEQRAGQAPASEFVQAEIFQKKQAGKKKAASGLDKAIEIRLIQRNLAKAKVVGGLLTDDQKQELAQVAADSVFEGEVRSKYEEFIRANGKSVKEADAIFEKSRPSAATSAGGP